jgi:hypothetical protein
VGLYSCCAPFNRSDESVFVGQPVAESKGCGSSVRREDGCRTISKPHCEHTSDRNYIQRAVDNRLFTVPTELSTAALAAHKYQRTNVASFNANDVTSGIFEKLPIGWAIKLAHREIVLPRMDGVGYIEYLIARPGKGIRPEQLAIVVGNDAHVRIVPPADDETIATKDWSSQAVVTEMELAQYRREHDFMRDQVRRARSWIDRKRFETQRQFLAAHIKSALSKGGQPRKFLTEKDYLRSKQSRAMRRVREKLQKSEHDVFVAFERFLRETISTESGHWWYRPSNIELELSSNDQRRPGERASDPSSAQRFA